jgi:PAS domain S-box-containing protein
MPYYADPDADDSPGRTKSVTRPGFRTLLASGSALAVALLLANAVVSFASTRRIAANNRLVLRTDDGLGHLERVLSTLKDAETGQRGFLLTGKVEYLGPYDAAVSSVADEIRRLRGLLDDRDQQRRLGLLEAKVAEKLDELRETVDARRQHGAEAALGVVMTDRGRRAMDEIRRIIGEMDHAERGRLSVRMAESETSLARAEETFLVASGAALAVVVLLWLLVHRHLATRQRDEDLLLDQLERWRVTLASIGDGVIVTDHLGRITFVNLAAEWLTGRGADAVGRPLAEAFRIVNEDTGEIVEDPVSKVLREGTVVGLANRTVLIHSDGTERPIHDSAAPVLDRDGGIAGVVLVFRDDSERRTAERLAAESSRRKDEFLAMLAHELRNPLASIRTAVEVFDTPGSEDHTAWAKSVIDRQVGHLAHLLDDLLDVSRITRGVIQIRTQSIDAFPVIQDAIETVRPLIDDRRHRLVTSISADTMRLEADPVRLEQILVNLLANAAKYTPAGGRITVSAEHVGGQIILRVADDGVGIDPDVLPRIFDLFAQGQRSLGRSEGGLGVGLTIVRRLVELHGGSVSARSEGPGQGSEVTVRLPALEEKAEPPAEPPAPAPRRASARILIVDDNKDLALGLGRMLRFLGHEVETVFDGPDGVEAARRGRPDVILLDIGLPTMDGYEVARTLRGDADLSGVLIIAISGYGQEEDRRRSLESGMDHHLTKPVDARTIAELIGVTG